VAAQINGKCLCALGDFSTMAVTTAIQRFPEDFAVHVSDVPAEKIKILEQNIA
jgi:NADH-quinone oxidoreductase subunit F